MGKPTRAATGVAIAALLVSSPGGAQLRPRTSPPTTSPAPVAPRTPAPPGAAASNLPVFRIGALLPLSGPSLPFGEEMRRGMELAAAELNPAPKKPEPPPAAPGPTAPTTPVGGEAKAAPTEKGPASETKAAPEPAPTVRIVLEALDVEPLNTKDAETDFAQLAAASSPVVFTASPTPTLAIYPLASSRDVLVVHQGLPSDSFPTSSRTLLQLRPSPAALAETLAAYAAERGIRRLALLAGGDEFGKALRATLSARWRDRGAPLVIEESFAIDTPDLRSRLARVTRMAPEAVCLAFRGPDLGELARQLRNAGYTGLLLALDDDPAALLAAGPALDGMIILSDAFVAEPDSVGARFAHAYQTRFGRAPSRFAANAYQAVLILAEGAKTLFEGGRTSLGGSRLRETLIAHSAFPSIFGGPVKVRGDGSIERPLALFTVEDGRATFVRYVAPTGQPVAPRP